MMESPLNTNSQSLDAAKDLTGDTSGTDHIAGDLPSANSAWKEATPKLRSDLRFFPQRTNGKSIIVVEDPVRSKFFRIGRCEYLFISLLDGVNTVEQAFEKAKSKWSSANGEFEVTIENTEQICKFLSNSQLIRIADLESLQKRVEANEKSQLLSRFNPIFQKLPVAHPATLLKHVDRLAQIAFSFPMLLIWMAVLAFAGYSVSANWHEFSAASSGILSGTRWIWLIGVWLVLKVIHEFGHATACHRFGGYVRETGLAFICFFPVAYVDVSSSWRFSNKWHRIIVAAAGIYMELLVAASAAILWCWFPDSIFRDLLYNVAIVASVTTVFFNANPLMKFDGYFVLSDFVEVPSLYQKSQSAVQSKFSWFFLGNRPSGQSGFWLLSYGIAIVFWRIAMCIGIFIAVSLVGEGLGLILAVIAASFWIYPMISKTAKALDEKTSPTNWTRLAFSTSITVCGLFGLGFSLFVPHRVIAPGVVDFSDSQIVRPTVAGFIDAIHVTDGQFVKTGEKLLTLRNESVQKQLQQNKIAYQQATNRIESHRSIGSTGDVASETKMLRKLNADVLHSEKQVSELSLFAKNDGFVQLANASTLLGSFVKSTDEIMLIAMEDRKEIVAAIPQHQFDGLTTKLKDEVAVFGNLFTANTGRIRCLLKKFEPRATTQSPNILLCANVGGAIPVKNINGASADTLDPKVGDVEFLFPHVIAKFELDNEASEKLKSGQRVNVVLQAKATSLGYQLYKNSRRWLKHKYQLAVDASK